MGLLGGFGMTYGVLMAHGRSFVPDHLLGRGITLLNVLFIGGAGVLQPLSGALMKRMADAAAGAGLCHAAPDLRGPAGGKPRRLRLRAGTIRRRPEPQARKPISRCRRFGRLSAASRWLSRR